MYIYLYHVAILIILPAQFLYWTSPGNTKKFASEVMDMDEYLDEMFDFKPIMPEIYSLQPLFSQGNNTTTLVQAAENSYQASKRSHMMTTNDHHHHHHHNHDQQLLMNSTSSWKASPASSQETNIMMNNANLLLPPSSSTTPAAPQLISFDNSNNFLVPPTINNSDSVGGPFNNSNLGHHEVVRDHSSSSQQIIRFSSMVEDDDDSIMNEQYHDATKKSFTTANRTPVQAQDHLIAERKRRRKLGQLFITLSKTVPGLKKLDKASLLEDAIDYLKALQERVNALEEEEVKRSSMDTSKEENNINIRTTSGESATPEIKARISNKNVLIKICCKKQKGLMSRIPSEMEKMHLSVADMRVMPFGDAALDITVLAEMHNDFQGTVKDIVDQLESILFNPAA